MPTWPLRVLLAAALATGPVQAQEIPPPAYQLAAQRAGIPSTVLYAVALQESGVRRDDRIVPWPWSLNVAGQSRRYATRSTRTSRAGSPSARCAHGKEGPW